MSFPLISVIIPIYNTACYLRRCLESVCCQSLRDLEIICVNDCSTDESGRIITEYATRDRRVLPIHLGKNCGEGAARNIGIAAAKGEWLGFVDSDDAIAPNFYENLYATTNLCNPEIVKGLRWSERSAPQYIDKSFNDKIKQDKFCFIAEFSTAIYNAFFIKENNINFLQNCTVNADVTFLYKAVLLCKQINFTDKSIYYYYDIPSSANTSIYTLKKSCDYIKSVETILNYLNIYMNNDNRYLMLYLQWVISCLTIPNRTAPSARTTICSKIAEILPVFVKKNRTPELLVRKLNQYFHGIEELLSPSNSKKLTDWLSLTMVQRLRLTAAMKLQRNPLAHKCEQEC